MTKQLLFSGKNGFLIWALTRENLSLGFANNKGTDQPAHPRSLISTFVIRLLESIVSRLAASNILIFILVIAAEQGGLNITFSETQRQGLLRQGPYFLTIKILINGHINDIKCLYGPATEISVLQ